MFTALGEDDEEWARGGNCEERDAGWTFSGKRDTVRKLVGDQGVENK